ncbi:MAG: type II toxin-antitoxin system RelE/ParE family toxin [Actinomycetota bacterium]|nr:type II toxin-antitoxin system RelE/ParE family toxin [Actinomycetota bacterium]
MSYSLSIPRSVNKRMERLPAEVYDRLDSAILALADEPRPAGCVKLKGREDWRIRVGDYRIVYGIDDEQRIVEVLNVAHRRDVYR